MLGRSKNDHLIFEFQQDLATALAYRDQGGMLGVEHFMRDVYSHLQTVSLVTDLFFEHVQEVLGMTSGSSAEQQVERSIVVRSGTVRLTALGRELWSGLYLLMRLFLQAGTNGMPLHHRTRQMVSGHHDLVNDQFRASKRVARIFFELLTETEAISFRCWKPCWPQAVDPVPAGIRRGGVFGAARSVPPVHGRPPSAADRGRAECAAKEQS
jgi:[protein-PII] uridylyltransferase